jgi:hypothetical protein
VITTTDAVAIARLSLPDGRHNPEGMEALARIWGAGDRDKDVLAEWIVRWGPVVAAAEEFYVSQAAWLTHLGYNGPTNGPGWDSRCRALDVRNAARKSFFAAVHSARRGGAE